jgi:hypothetical protein
MTEEWTTISKTLESIARTTWTDLRDGETLGISQGETTLTDRALLTLVREHPSLTVRKHPSNEEVRTGADWEWWIEVEGLWTCLLLQAKKLDGGRYRGLCKKQPSGTYQVDAIIKSCWSRSVKLGGTVWPLYCFYNYWGGPWPPGIPNVLHPDRPEAVVDSDEMPLYGCAVVHAQHVRRHISDKVSAGRRTARDTYLQHCRPLSLIFDIESAKTPGKAATITELLSRLSELSLQHSIRLPSDQSRTSGQNAITASIRGSRPASRVGRGVAPWTMPEPVARPPEYVLDMIDGSRPRPRRLKPLAARVAILSSNG